MSGAITEKKLRNKRFRKTEEAIIMAFFTSKTFLSVNRLIKLAGISRSTFYRHHRNVYEVASDYESYLIRQYAKTTRKFIKRQKSINLRNIYLNMLIFIRAYNKLFTFILKYGDSRIIEKIIITIKPVIINSSPVTEGTVFKMHIKEISGIIEEWVATDFDKESIIPTVDKMMYLTNTANKHFSPLTKA